MRRPLAIAAAMFISASLWAGIASTSDSYERSSRFVLGAGLLIAVSTSIVGMIAGASRWAKRLGLGVGASMLALGLVFPISGWSISAMVLAGVAIAGLGGTSFDGLIRQRPPADGPPARAVLLTLLLLLAPPVWALATPNGLGLAAGLGAALCWAGMVWYGKAGPGSLMAVRFVIPAGLAVVAAVSGLRLGALVALTALGVAALAWTVDARIAVHPLAEPGTTVPIPPELAPRDILDAAGIDDRGRRAERDL